MEYYLKNWTFNCCLVIFWDMIPVDYRLKCARQPILCVKIVVWLAKLKYLQKNDLDKADIDIQVKINHNPTRQHIVTPTHQVRPIQGESTLYHANHKAAWKTRVFERKIHFLNIDKQYNVDLVD